MNEAPNMHAVEKSERKRLPLACKIIYLLTAVSAVLYAVFMNSTSFADWFNRYVSAWGRFALAKLTDFLPFSVAELLILLIPFFLGLLITIGIKHFCDSNRSMLVYIGILLSGVCVIGILFVWNFAAGYYGTPLEQKLQLERKKSTAEELAQTASMLASEISELSEEIVFLENGRSIMPYSYDTMNEKLIESYDILCQKYDFLHTFKSRTKPVMLSEPMSYTHITGVYSFFTGEANINVNFPDYTIPYTAAHELAHQRGIAREDEANFIAFLVCMESNDPYIRYSGYLNLYEYVASALYSASPQKYWEVHKTLPSEIHAEQQAYSLFFDKYRDNVAADISEATNNAYLQSQGASAGTRSYGLVVDLAVAYYRPFFG
ncbi:MAG: DUF3810 domain-containing protein [Ruminococcaceae bacterium]|nr:DUF3810 domain-containing protein [Oscillospiraceae bacterium]